MKIRVIDATLRRETWRLQPGRYIVEVSRHLAAAGHDVQILSGGAPALPVEDTVDGFTVRRLRSVRYPFLMGNPALDEALSGADLVLWNTGVVGLLHLRPSHRIKAPLIGLITSPLPTLGELLPVGPRELIRNLSLHLVSALLPRPCPLSILGSGRFRGFIVMNHTTRRRLSELGISPESIHVVPSGVDPPFREIRSAHLGSTSASRSEILVLFLGSAVPYRGLPDLLYALRRALRLEPNLRLVVLSRRRQDQLQREEIRMHHLCDALGITNAVRFMSGFFEQDEIIEHLRAADIVALPFRAVPSGTPLTILEALAAGKPVVTTNVDCLPELMPPRNGYCVAPRDPKALAAALLKAVRELPRADAPKPNGHVPTWKEAMDGLESALSSLAS